MAILRHRWCEGKFSSPPPSVSLLYSGQSSPPRCQSRSRQRRLGHVSSRSRDLNASLDYCLELLASAHATYRAAQANVRRDLNHAVFERLYIDDDEVVASDLTPAFQRLLSDSLPTDLATERKSHQTRQVRTSDLWIVPEVADVSPRGQLPAHVDPPPRHVRESKLGHTRPMSGIERPRGHSLGKARTPALHRTEVLS